MKEGKKWKTAFRTHYRFFEYLIMPFDLINALATEQKFMNNMFQDILNNYIIFYLDDILVYFNKSFENYIQKVKKVLN